MNSFIKTIKDIFKKPIKIGRDKSLVVKNLSNMYNNKIFLNNINFVVYKGEMFSIIGLSGGGKSTLLKSIINLNKHKGDIYFFGKPLFFSKKLIGYCSQDDSFFNDLTVLENIKLFSELNGVKQKEGIKYALICLDKLKMKNCLSIFPKDLSGGQKKRLNIILSCLHKPKLLILDEPFAGLDYYNRRILWDFLISLKNKSVSIVLTTHLLKEAQNYSTRVLILKNGNKFAYGSFNDIKNKIRFNYLYTIKFSTLSNKFFEKLNHFCLLKRINIVYNYKTEVQFAIKDIKSQEIINNFNKKNNQNYKIINLKEPDLDEVMLASK